MTMRVRFSLLGLLPLLCCLPSHAEQSLVDQYADGNRTLAAHIATLPGEQILAEERRLAPEATELLRSLKPLIREGGNGLAIQDQLLAQLKAKGWRPMLVGYNGFPAAIAVSVNDGVLNGFPNAPPFPKPPW